LGYPVFGKLLPLRASVDKSVREFRIRAALIENICYRANSSSNQKRSTIPVQNCTASGNPAQSPALAIITICPSLQRPAGGNCKICPETVFSGSVNLWFGM
jgi:hypothetical protein